MAEPNKTDVKSPLLILLAAAIAFIGNYFGGNIAPEPVPLPAVETWYVTRAGEVVDSPAIIAVANTLEQGSYELVGYPKSGKITRLGVTINKDGIPTPPVPPAPVPPRPEPTPIPVPPKPDLKGFALEVWEHARSLPPAECENVAKNYQVIVSGVATHRWQIVQQADNELARLNESAMQSVKSRDNWHQFAVWIAAKMSGNLTLQQYASLSSEVVQGLRAVKESQ